MPKRPREEKEPAPKVELAKHVTEIASSEMDHNTPEEDALERADRAGSATRRGLSTATWG